MKIRLEEFFTWPAAAIGGVILRLSRARTSTGKRSSSAATLLILSLLAGSCGKQNPPNPEVLARVGEAEITKAAFLAELDRRARNGQSVASPAEREAVLNDLIRLETFFAKAKAAGVDRDSELVQQFKRIVAAKYEDQEWKKQPAPPKPEPGEIELFYNAHKDEFTSPEKIHVAILFVRVPIKSEAEQQQKFQKQAAELRQKALEQSAAQPDFGLLAQENSDDQATRYRGGDCGWITRQNPKYRWDPKVVEALFTLKKTGEISPVIRAAEGFYIGKLIERKSAETAPLAAVRERIERQLIAAEQKRGRSKFETEQRRGLRVEINEALLKTIQAPARFANTNAAAPPAMPTP